MPFKLVLSTPAKWFAAPAYGPAHDNSPNALAPQTLTLRRIGEQVRACKEGHKNGANELVYLEDEMALIIDNLHKLRRNQAKLEHLRNNGAASSKRVLAKLKEIDEQKESFLRQEAAVEGN